MPRSSFIMHCGAGSGTFHIPLPFSGLRRFVYLAQRDADIELHILCWRRKLSPTLDTAYYSCPDNASSPMWTQQALNWASLGGRWAEISTHPWQSIIIGVVRWPAAGDTAGSSLRRLSSLQHRVYTSVDAGRQAETTGITLLCRRSWKLGQVRTLHHRTASHASGSIVYTVTKLYLV